MKREVLFIALAFLLLLSGCTSEKKEYVSAPEGRVQDFEPEVPEYKINEILINARRLDNQFVATSGVVEETVSTQSYTYAKIKDGTGEIWVAGPRTELKPGDKVELYGAMVLLNFNAPALNKTLDVLLMAQSFTSGEPYSFHGTPSGSEAPPVNISVEKLEDGYTIGEILTNSEKLAGGEVKFRAVITKVLPDIMDKTWIHLQDGTSSNTTGENDITVTYSGSEEFKVGDVVVVKGELKTNVDIGSGYFFRVLIEDADIQKE